MKAITFTRVIFKKYPRLVVINTALLFFANIFDAASIFSLVVIVDLFLNPNLANASIVTQKITAVIKFTGLPVTLGWLLAVFMFFNILKSGFQIFAQRAILKTKYALLRELMLGTFEDFLNARWLFFTKNNQGVLINTFIREMTVIGDALSAMGRYFSCIFQIALYLVVPFYLSWQVTSVTIASAVIFVMPFFWLGKISYKLGKLNTSTANKISTVIQENLSLAKVVLGFGKQDKSVSALAFAFDAHREVTIKSQVLNFAMPLAYFPFGILVLSIGLFVARSFTLPLSETAVLFYALARVVPLIGNAAEYKNCLDNFFPSYEQVISLKDSACAMRQPSGAKQFTDFSSEINIENLAFGYDGSRPILSGVNICISKGKMIAIVGESGAGKSTLIDLIMGFLQPSSGSIAFDGVSLQEFDINSLRRNIGYVPQESVLFNMSVRDNLRWANDMAGDDKIKQACIQANAEEFIGKLSHGYETIVGDRGVRLSGGQIQRIALARAILRQPKLLILDEATSALDTHSERLIQQAIENIAKETTVVVVAHRLSTIINADYVYVLKNGRIIEEGRYSELILANGSLSNMARLQTLEASIK